MTALACLRILVNADSGPGAPALAAIVSKVGGAFLETRWVWPRRFGEIAPGAFLLADPRSPKLDASELTALSDELHFRLFGEKGAGAVTLALLEGDQASSTRFAALHPDDLRGLMAGVVIIDGMAGQLSRITPHGVQAVTPRPGVTPLRLVEGGSPRRAAPADEGVECGFHAIWCTLKETVIGNGVASRRKGSRARFSIVDGAGEMPGPAAVDFDLTCLEGAPRAMTGSQGLVYLPISFSSTVHRPTRERYIEALETLPRDGRPRLAAAVYDVPRAPGFAVIGQLKAFLGPYFSFIDLQTADPAFQIDALMMEAVHSVTLALPETDERGRLAAATRFMANRDAYQRRHIWTAITNVRTRRELDFCIGMRTPFLSGRAVSEQLVAPADPIRCAGDRLPLRETVVTTLADRTAAAG